MTTQPSVVQTNHQYVAMIPMVVLRSDIQSVMDPAIHEVIDTIKAQGISITGPWLTHHLRRPTDSFDLEVCVPVASTITPVGRVIAGELRAVKAATTTYQGGYEGLGAAWAEFILWVQTEGHAPASDLWEVYAVGPESGQPPENWRTELFLPLLA